MSTQTDRPHFDVPDFKQWDRVALERFSLAAYVQLQQIEMANEQLRLDNRDAMKEVRRLSARLEGKADDWK